MNGSIKRDIRQEAQEGLERGIAFLQEIENQRRGMTKDHIFIDDAPYAEQMMEMARAEGRRLGKYPDPIRLIDVNSKRELHIPAEAFPEGLNNPDVEIRLKDEFEFPKESSSTVGFIRVNGIEYPIIGIESTTAGFGRNDDGVSWQAMEWEDCEGNYREPTLDSFSQLRPGYKGRTPNLFNDRGPCSKVNPKDVAKRRAKNKAARKNKRK